ncbi:MAG: aminoacetone oxidase family FAD-binding enzyme [bacterium]|nr:aminoacetone oxidase family FAD-binding enzyme [bacterium]
MENLDLVVIGGGAAGLFCAALLAEGGRKVVLLEHNPKLGRKILASGGGNCNFTNLDASVESYRSLNPRFATSALKRFGPAWVLAQVQAGGVAVRQKAAGQYFCSKGAASLLDWLVKRCERAGVSFRLPWEVTGILALGDGFEVATNHHPLQVKELVVATGGLSYPVLGASDGGMRWAKSLGLKLVRNEPALVPLKIDGVSELAGISLPVELTLGRRVFKEELLFTHRGISGPAVLQASLFWNPGEELALNFLPQVDLMDHLEQAKKQGKSKLLKALTPLLPERFAAMWLDRYGPKDDSLHQLSKKQRLELQAGLQNWRFIPQGTEGYKKAEATSGGVSTEELSSKTMAAKRWPGLYFIGEVVDMTGMVGGYNFQWAWSSAAAAAEAILNPRG